MTRPAPAPQSHRGRATWLLAWTAATAVVLAFTARPSTANSDADEVYWIGSSYYFELLVHGQWGHPDWKLLPARENPPVAKYVLGLALRSAGRAITTPDLLSTFYLLFEEMPGAWGEGAERDKRAQVAARIAPAAQERLRADGHIALDHETLVLARRVSLACVGFTSLLLFIGGWRWQSPLAGLIASQLFLLHPGVIEAGNHAHADAMALLFSTAAAWATFALLSTLLRDGPPSRVFILGGATGLALALACGAKMNSLVVAFAAAAALAVVAARFTLHDRTRRVRVLIAGVIAAATALLVFIIINPALLGDVAGGFVATFREHRLTEAIQARFLAGHLVDFSAKLGAVNRFGLLATPLFIVVVCAAVLLFFRRCAFSRFVASWFLLGLLCVTIWIPFARWRYVLPVVLPGTLVVACASAWLADRIRRSP